MGLYVIIGLSNRCLKVLIILNSCHFPFGGFSVDEEKEYDIGLGEEGAIVCVYHVEIHWSGSFTPHSMIRSCINKQLLSRYIIACPDIRASQCMRQKGTYNQLAIFYL